jgi:transcriptional antiterminator
MPAQGINFESAKRYLAWLSKKVGRTYRLPSESEREYFTRAGTATPCWFGDTTSGRDASYNQQLLMLLQEDDRQPLAVLSEKIGVAVSTINDRIKRLVRSGMISKAVDGVERTETLITLSSAKETWNVSLEAARF